MERKPARIALLPGDGVGGEVTAEVRALLYEVDEMGAFSNQVEQLDWGADRWVATGEALPPGGVESLRRFDALVVGAFGDPRVPGNQHAREILLGMRDRLDLFANVRPVRCLSERLNPLRSHRREDIDLVIVRENTEGLYAGIGGTLHSHSRDAVAVEEMIVTRPGIERVVRFAFQLARRRRHHVTLVDKANALRFAGTLWRETFSEVAALYGDCGVATLHVDVAAMELISNPERFDVIVTGNLFGDILSEIGAALQGGIGLAASANLDPEGMAMFEPVHGSAPELAGSGRANPFGALLSCAMLFDHFACPALASAVRDGVRDAVERGTTTPDLGGSATTAVAGEAVRRAVRESCPV